MRLTIDGIMQMGPCHYYPRQKIEKLFQGRKYITEDDIVRMDIPPKDMLWVLIGAMGGPQRGVLSRKAALDVADVWDAPAIVRKYLETGDMGLQDQVKHIISKKLLIELMSESIKGQWECALSSALAIRTSHSHYGTFKGIMGISEVRATDTSLDFEIFYYVDLAIDIIKNKIK